MQMDIERIFPDILMDFFRYFNDGMFAKNLLKTQKNKIFILTIF